ncbi:hypothetical protein WAK64_16635 [Bacillus spongiae]|uniref:CBM-cenC domain-containing protein n=1 Tax=Bacillus spongiae TaxID=2683610 RepID=A0ABU8HH16_9BACI
MKKIKGLVVSVLLAFVIIYASLIPNRTIASEIPESFITTKDFKLENGKVEWIDNNNKSQKTLLPPLEDILPWDSYDKGLPKNTKDRAVTGTGDVVEYVGINVIKKTNGKGMTWGQLWNMNNNAYEFVLYDNQRKEKYLASKKWVHLLASLNPNSEVPMSSEGFITQIRYHKDSGKAEGTKIQFDGYWKLVENAVSNNNGNEITKTFSSEYGVDLETANEFSYTLGLSAGVEAGFTDIVTATYEINHEFSYAYSWGQTITESNSWEDSFTFGNDSGLPFIGGVYQLIGNYKVIPGNKMQTKVNNLKEKGWNASLAPEFKYSDNLYRQIQIDRDPNLWTDAHNINLTNIGYKNIEMTGSANRFPDENGDLGVINLAATSSNGYINKTMNVNPLYNEYIFSVWLRADEPHQATLRLRSQGNNGADGKNDFVKTVNVTNEWQEFSIIGSFDTDADWLRATLYPAGFSSGETGSVQIFSPEVFEIE